MIFLLCKHCILGRVTESSGGQLRGWGNLKWAFDLVWGWLWPGIHQAFATRPMKSYEIGVCCSLLLALEAS